ncbi:MAG: hypothetical protein ACREUZ_00400 [Burkholderiales bacterium]
MSHQPGAGLNRSAADPTAALAMLRQKAHALAAEPIAPAQRFAALEALRPTAIATTESRRSIYAGKPIPLAEGERQCWEDMVGLWQAFYFAYALCADSGQSEAAAATVSQRALDSLGRAICEHTHAYRAVPGTIWKEFHNCYRSAADCSLADIAVSDPHHADSQTSCKHAYLVTVLYECANPYALCAVQMRVLGQWLPHWLGLVDIMPSEPLWASRSPLALDLGAEVGARLARDTGTGEGVRYLDTSALGMRLRELADCLRSAQPAAELPAAADMPRAVLERLLTHLYVQWCSAGSATADERQGNALRAQAALGMHAVHFQISGRAFRQPGLRYTREEEHDLATFGHITERTEHRLLTGRSAALEPWEVLSRNASGLAVRRKADLTSRLAHGQLVALRTTSIDPPSLGVIQRLKIDAAGETHIGIRLVRGEVRGVALRPAGDATQKYERALLIEPDAQRAAPATLLVEAGRFAPGARGEMHTARAETITLGAYVERGFDFDRLAFTS